MIALEDVGHRATYLDVLVRDIEPGAMVEVRTAWQAQLVEQLRQGVRLPQGVNQLGLLPIAQELPIDAHLFFYDFIRLLQNVLLELQSSNFSLKGLNMLFQLRPFGAWWRTTLALHRCRGLVAK